MYQDKFVVVLKCNGKNMREKNGIVYLPFNSEYSILLKNLNNTRACVNIDIDGKSVMMYNLIIDPNKCVELEGYINSNMHVCNRFKFIQKTNDISNYRGEKIDDGIIRIEVRFEKKHNETITITNIQPYVYYPYVSQYPIVTYTDSSSHNIIYESSDFNSVYYCSSNSTIDNFTSKEESLNENIIGEGITVRGSQCDQNFNSTYIRELENSSSILILQLKGCINDIPINKPITISSKIICETCGKSSRSNMSFCGYCGTSLI